MPIRKLSEEVIRRIAAGEVVERPASVLKELLENALDAGARSVTVEWEGAGRKKIRVTDDGRGMAPEDVPLALERHATSKIGSWEDLEKLDTFGFRGEALPSIAAVSRFRLVTRTAQAREGWSVEEEGGKKRREGPAGAPPGTTVAVEDLFFSTPARHKFLKSDATERGLLLRTVEDTALAALHVRFQVFAEGKEILSLPAARKDAPPEEALRERLEALWGKGRLGALKKVRQTGRFLTLWGWISDVHSHQGSGRYQRFFVNRRAVTSRRLTHGLYEAYRGSLLVGRHPLAALFLEVDPALVDVNVHPAKREVRFSHEEEVHGFLIRSLQTALSGPADMPSALPRGGGPSASDATPGRAPSFGYSGGKGTPSWAESRAAYAVQAPPAPAVPAQDSLWGKGKEKEEFGLENTEKDLHINVFKESKPEPLMQLDGTYILARLNDQFFIFDQHAAAERVLYEKLSEAAKNETPHRQTLLLPWVWEPSLQIAAVIKDHLENLGRLGYELEPFGPQSYRVKAVPGALGDSPRVRELLEGLAEDLAQETIPRQWDAILVRAACRGSVKAGDLLKTPEMAKVLTELQACRMPWSCPHGRPTFLRLSPEELAKRFRRT